MANARAPKRQVLVEFAFYAALFEFHRSHRGAIRQHYKELSRKFLDFNDPKVRPGVFLREPQFEALEIYIFLKEYLDNAPVRRIFEDWYFVRGPFERRGVGVAGAQAQSELFLPEEHYRQVFARLVKDRLYPNYIFALTMGTGKTILMATCIFYEFILARKFPKDPRFCHNALVFAPDRTVLQALKEIQEFDLSKVVPPEYAKILTPELRFHFLEDPGVTLQTDDGSSFNIIVSNAQKIILKKRHKERPATERLFQDTAPIRVATVADEAADLYADAPEDEAELTPNQRFEKLARLHQLGIYVDEAHHAFGEELADDLGVADKLSAKSLRLTIDALAARLGEKGRRVVACYNYTGTPYVGSVVLPEVVYAYGLKKAIDRGFLKQVKLVNYTNPKTYEAVKRSIKEFWEAENGKRYEDLLPKMAFFASTIEELTKELRPAVEKALRELKIPDGDEKILVNVGDAKETTNDDIREFNALDRPTSQKQFILLVGKGREGWNCRSLFAVALFRTPKSKIFVLQATMRCLRAIGPTQSLGRVFLSDENMAILQAELQQNFHLSTDEIQRAGVSNPPAQIRVRKDVIIPLLRPHKVFTQEEKVVPPGLDLRLGDVELDRYRMMRQERDGFDPNAPVTEEDISHDKVQRRFSAYTLVAEVARYLNAAPLRIEEILAQSKAGLPAIVDLVNQFNEVLYGWIVPRLCEALYEVKSERRFVRHDVRLVRPAPDPPGYYLVHAAPEKTLRPCDAEVREHAEKSFHLDTYCFDSNPERQAFLDAIRAEDNTSVYFTGMLTHGQTEFFVYYIDPESSALRRYHPDFLIQRGDTWLIVEVKGDHMIDDPIVLAKQDVASGQRGFVRHASRNLPSVQAREEIVAGAAPQLEDLHGTVYCGAGSD